MLLTIALAQALVPHENRIPCGTFAMREANKAGDYPIRPSMAEGDGYDTEHFHIQGDGYTPSDEEYQLLGEIFEEVWAVEIIDMGYRVPPGESPLTVYIEPMGRSLYGYAAFERDGITPYLALNSDMSWTGTSTEDAWKVTAAHEFFHAAQYAYDDSEAGWWMEASSTWMEDQVYDDLNDYAYYLEEGGWPDYPEISMVAENGWHEYGEVIWPLYLSTFHGGPETIKTLWEACETDWALDVTADFFGGNKGFQAALADFQIRNVLGYAGYEEGASWYPMYFQDALPDGAELPATVAPTEYYADYLGVNYWRVPIPATPNQNVVVEFAGGTRDDGTEVIWQLTLAGTDGTSWDLASTTTTNTESVYLGGFGSTWTEAWVLVGILSPNTGVDHNQYSSSPRYTEIPPTYQFTVSLSETPPDDTGTEDSGGDDSGGSDTALAPDSGTDPAGDDRQNARRRDPACGCDSGTSGLLSLGSTLLGAWALRRRAGRGQAVGGR